MGKDKKRLLKLGEKITRLLYRVAEETGAKPVLTLQYPDKEFLVFGLDANSDEIIADLYNELFPTLEHEIENIAGMPLAELTSAYKESDIEDLLVELEELPDGNEKSALQDILFEAMTKITSKRSKSK